VLRAGDLISKPTLVYAIIGLCVVAYMGQVVSGEGNWRAGSVVDQGLLWGPDVQAGEYWRIVTSGFLHGGLLHLGVNMYALYAFGPAIQQAVGIGRAALIYTGGLFGGSAAVLLFDWGQATLGASGAVLGLAGGLTGIMWARGMNITQTPLFRVMLFNLALPLFVPIISFWGHFGGVAGGFAVGAAMATLDKNRRASADPIQESGGPSPSLVAGGLIVVGLAVLAIVGAQLALDPIL
jgi:membrane associated rhomboid family serine protease